MPYGPEVVTILLILSRYPRCFWAHMRIAQPATKRSKPSGQMTTSFSYSPTKQKKEKMTGRAARRPRHVYIALSHIDHTFHRVHAVFYGSSRSSKADTEAEYKIVLAVGQG